jgi:hypothetical protein
MRKNIHLAVIACIFLFVACSKSDHTVAPPIGNKTVPTSTSAVFTFSVNDTAYDFSGIAPDQYSQITRLISPFNNDTTWELEANYRPTGTNLDWHRINFTIKSPTITKTTYTGSSRISAEFAEPGFYNVDANNDLVSVTITSVHDSLIDGNFVCHLTPYGIEAINGIFKNVPVK